MLKIGLALGNFHAEVVYYLIIDIKETHMLYICPPEICIPTWSVAHHQLPT